MTSIDARGRDGFRSQAPCVAFVVVLIVGASWVLPWAGVDQSTRHGQFLGRNGPGILDGRFSVGTPLLAVSAARAPPSVSVLATLLKEPGAIPVGGFPFGEAYDPANARLFVADFAATDNNLTVVDTISNHVIATIPLSYGIERPVYDSSNGLLYVGDCCSQVYVINATTNRVAATIPLINGCSPGCSPDEMAYDPANRDIYVVDGFTNNLSVIHDETVIATIGVGTDPYGIGYDPATGNLYVSNEGSDNVTIVSGSTNEVVGSIPSVQPGPAVVADSSNGIVFVAGNNASGLAEVTALDGNTGQVIAIALTRNASGGAA